MQDELNTRDLRMEHRVQRKGYLDPTRLMCPISAGQRHQTIMSCHQLHSDLEKGDEIRESNRKSGAKHDLDWTVDSQESIINLVRGMSLELFR